MRSLLALLLAAPLIATFAPASLHSPAPVPREPRFVSEPVMLDDSDPERRRVGRLQFVRGWAMRSDDPRFGGLSSIHVDGRQVTAMSDAGWLTRFEMGASGPERLRIQPLEDGPGDPHRKRDRDIESLTVRGGQAWLGYERHNAIWRYDRATWRSTRRVAPEAMDDWPNNAGPESLVRLADGRFLVISEGARAKNGATRAHMFDGDPVAPDSRAIRFGYRAPAGFRPTDAAQLPDGGLLVLNRRISLMDGIAAKLVLIDPRAIAEGAIVEGPVVAEFAPPLTTDNYEALSVTREGGRTILWIASDDNYSGLQRSLLMKFVWLD